MRVAETVPMQLVKIDQIDLNDEYQVLQWTEIFDVDRNELAQAVRVAGTCSSDVKRYLREQGGESAAASRRRRKTDTP
jgi:Protein of unknown function (DUF3606)